MNECPPRTNNRFSLKTDLQIDRSIDDGDDGWYVVASPRSLIKEPRVCLLSSEVCVFSLQMLDD